MLDLNPFCDNIHTYRIQIDEAFSQTGKAAGKKQKQNDFPCSGDEKTFKPLFMTNTGMATDFFLEVP